MLLEQRREPELTLQQGRTGPPTWPRHSKKAPPITRIAAAQTITERISRLGRAGTCVSAAGISHVNSTL